MKIKIEGNSNVLAFVERTQPYLSKALKETRQDIVPEVGELLPQNFKFVRTGIPVSAIQEENLHQIQIPSCSSLSRVSEA